MEEQKEVEVQEQKEVKEVKDKSDTQVIMDAQLEILEQLKAIWKEVEEIKKWHKAGKF